MGCVCGANACGVTVRCSPTTVIKEVPAKITLDDLSLDVVCEQLVNKGWTAENTLRVRAAYREFLRQFVGKNEIKDVMPPTQEVDNFWHQHILNTQKYERDCQAVFGFFLHHDPSTFKEEKVAK